jgi:hypothetical protein
MSTANPIVPFDTHQYVKRLIDAGFTESQAETQVALWVQALQSQLGELATKRDLQDQETVLRRDLQEMATASKRDLQELAVATQRDLQETKAYLEAKIEALDTKLSGRIEALDTKLSGRIDTLRAELGTELKYIKWLGGVILGALVALLVKAFWL